MRAPLTVTTVLLITFLLLSLPAHASTSPCTGVFESTLDVNPQATGGPTAGNYGRVCIDLNSARNQATVTFTAANNFGFVDSNIADLNLHTFTGVTFSEAIVSESSSGADMTSLFDSFTGSGTVNGFGIFNLTDKNKDASTQVDKIVFTVTRSTGTWSSAGDVLAANSQGYDAAAHIFVNSGTGNGNTYFVAEDEGGIITGGPVPEPSLVLFSLAGGLLVIFVSRKKRQDAKS